MRTKTIFLALALSLFSLSAVAGSGHDHGHSHGPVSQLQAEDIAINSIAKLVELGKIDKSWKSIGVMKSMKKDFSGHMEWVISFKNEKISDPAKQTLYVFLTEAGIYLAANYTGK